MSEPDWRAIRELTALRARLREIIERALLPSAPPVAEGAVPYQPAVDVWETDDEVIVEVELPGAGSSTVDVRLEAGTLVLSGELPGGVDGDGRFLRVERPRGPFLRRIPLPALAGGTPSATLRAGVLEVRLPRSARRSIAIERG